MGSGRGGPRGVVGPGEVGTPDDHASPRPYLRADGRLLLYGPFKRDGRHTAVSNAVFDSSLRDNNPEWGVRDTADLEKLADSAGLVLKEIAEMPANNLSLIFQRRLP